MNLSHTLRTCLAAGLAGLLSQGAVAADWRPGGAFVQGGAGEHVQCLTVGVSWPWEWKRMARGGEWSLNTELFASHWQAHSAGGGRQGFTQVGVVPMLRLRFDQGRSPWYVEAGIGLTLLDRDYRTPHKQFGTRFNFIDSIAVGRNFGTRGEHELSLRAVHVSNADIRKPNPGEDFLQLRYAMRF
jgi:lipid A 3-O-deacylase